MKKFYKKVTIKKSTVGYSVLLDNKPILTPAKKQLLLPNFEIAELVQNDWEMQTDEIKVETMIFMILASTAIDRVQDNKEQVIIDLSAYIEDELLCYRADSPNSLIKEQENKWRKWIDWGESKFNIDLPITAGIMPLDANPLAKQAVNDYLTANYKCNFRLMCFYELVANSGSFLLGLLMAEKIISETDGFNLANIEEFYQMKKWGDDPETLKKQAIQKENIKNAMILLNKL